MQRCARVRTPTGSPTLMRTLHRTSTSGIVGGLVYHSITPPNLALISRKTRTISHNLALISRSYEVIDLLTSAGANASAMDGKGVTPLHYATSRGTPEVCRAKY